ncbi:tripartite tricarboxylate transporter substrate binding protein [Roseomonas sp. JC162]|uniref:Tripartite tricarboxylate transporter substrate binding protein n=1 Tax=Neoroseomonas marina TaxID=1232220 RepID=A0A848EKI0_9PROT|nr:tripartite tricarboxylate transporter substrate-binding protein [Neoroseomonas marina]NMJ44446.1 tripartite tricarboxylate transporter substrate binding protein [Neoroseomonas marina]
MRIVVPFAAGGATDLFARKFADRATSGFGQPIVIENRGGAGGILGSSEVARAAPDGYTALFGTASTHGVNPTMMVRPAYDAIRDYAHVAIVGTAPLVVAVHPSVPANNLREMVELVRTRPGHYSYATAGVGTITQLAFEWLKQTQNLDITHVAYRGSNPALMDVLAGTIPLFLETFGPLIDHHRTGRIRIIAVLSARRSTSFPEILTGEEVGFPGAEFGTFNVLSLPAGAPAGIVNSLNRTAMATMKDEALQRDLRSLAIEPVTDSTPESAAAYVQAEIQKWAPLVRASGAQIE